MSVVLSLAWMVVALLRYSSLIAALAGVVVFGKNFIGLNARAAQADSAEIPVESWRGPGAVMGAKLLGLGVLLLVASLLLSAMLPPRL
ncbi:MAG TPA: hypothetical protein VGM68_07865 [Rhizomicrobium sp.]|jgi:hypothetical protein